jgi:hypothetical protein
MQQTGIRAVASFGDDPTKVEIILPLGDPNVMLADVATKPNFQLFGTAFLYSYPEEELARRPAQPANTLIEIGVPYCFHLPVNTMLMVKHSKAINHLVLKKVWTIRTEGSSDADYLSPTHVLYHNNTSIKTPNFPPPSPTSGQSRFAAARISRRCKTTLDSIVTASSGSFSIQGIAAKC